MRFTRFLSAMFALCASSAVSATTISTLNYVVTESDPKFTNYPVEILISGANSIANFDLAFAVGDGGPILGGNEAIAIRAIDYSTGTIFNGLPMLTNENPSLPSLSAISAGLTTNPATDRSANGLLATIYLDLTGASLGNHALSLNVQGLSGATNATLVPLNLEFQNGSLTINAVPEPCAFSIALLGGAGLAYFARSRCKPVLICVVRI